jgi:hypothetical protein
MNQVTLETSADGAVAVRGPRGAGIVVDARTRHVVRMQFVGHLMGEMMQRALGAVDGAVQPHAGISLLVDAEGQSGYDPEVRSLVTSWLLKRRSHLLASHVFSRAPMVKMWTQMLNLSLESKVFLLHEDRAEFERSAGQVVRESERMRAASRV